MEHHHFQWVNPLFLWGIFNSYVSLPEGNDGWINDSVHDQLRKPKWLFTLDGVQGEMNELLSQWIGLRENLQETMVFTIKYRAFRLKFSHHPILWLSGWAWSVTIWFPFGSWSQLQFGGEVQENPPERAPDNQAPISLDGKDVFYTYLNNFIHEFDQFLMTYPSFSSWR